MENFRNDSYCGLYCGACDIMSAYKKSINGKFQPEWNDLPHQIRDNIPRGAIECTGCKTGNVYVNCSKCQMRNCAIKKNVSSCIECNKYPCGIYKIGNIIKKIFKIEKKLPHSKIMKRNLETIKKTGIINWLNEQEKKWKCPDCDTSFSWYQAECTKCKRDLEGIKDYVLFVSNEKHR